MIDTERLLAWLGTRETKNSVGRAIYEGLTTRIQAGQFDLQDVAEFEGYFIAAADLTPKSTSVLWDGKVHLTRETANTSIDAITANPDWYRGEDREAWAVYGLTNLDREVT